MKVKDCRDCDFFEPHEYDNELYLCTKHRIVYLTDFSKQNAEECKWNK